MARCIVFWSQPAARELRGTSTRYLGPCTVGTRNMSKKEISAFGTHSFSSPFPPFFSSSPSPRQRKSLFCCFFIVSRFRLSVLPEEFPDTRFVRSCCYFAFLPRIVYSPVDLPTIRPACCTATNLSIYPPRGCLPLSCLTAASSTFFFLPLGPATAFF